MGPKLEIVNVDQGDELLAVFEYHLLYASGNNWRRKARGNVDAKGVDADDDGCASSVRIRVRVEGRDMCSGCSFAESSRLGRIVMNLLKHCDSVIGEQVEEGAVLLLALDRVCTK